MTSEEIRLKIDYVTKHSDVYQWYMFFQVLVDLKLVSVKTAARASNYAEWTFS